MYPTPSHDILCVLHHTVSSRETSEPTKPQTFFSPSHHQNISSKDNKNNRPSQIDNIHRSNLSHTSPQSSPVVGQLTPAAGAEDTTLHYLRVDREITFFALPNMMSCEFWLPCREWCGHISRAWDNGVIAKSRFGIKFGRANHFIWICGVIASEPKNNNNNNNKCQVRSPNHGLTLVVYALWMIERWELMS